MAILNRLLDHEYKELRRFKKIADQIEALDEEYQKLSDDELKENTKKLQDRLKNLARY